MNIKVVQMKTIDRRTESVETDMLAIEDDELRVLGMERVPKAFTGSLGIESTNAFQTFTHGRDAKRNQFVKVSGGNIRKRHAP